MFGPILHFPVFSWEHTDKRASCRQLCDQGCIVGKCVFVIHVTPKNHVLPSPPLKFKNTRIEYNSSVASGLIRRSASISSWISIRLNPEMSKYCRLAPALGSPYPYPSPPNANNNDQDCACHDTECLTVGGLHTAFISRTACHRETDESGSANASRTGSVPVSLAHSASVRIPGPPSPVNA